jgi:hypothetical protein
MTHLFKRIFGIKEDSSFEYRELRTKQRNSKIEAFESLTKLKEYEQEAVVIAARHPTGFNEINNMKKYKIAEKARFLGYSNNDIGLFTSTQKRINFYLKSGLIKEDVEELSVFESRPGYFGLRVIGHTDKHYYEDLLTRITITPKEDDDNEPETLREKFDKSNEALSERED